MDFSRPWTSEPGFPREITPGFFWFSTCLEIVTGGKTTHNHNSCFLFVGEKKSLLADTGMPYGWEALRDQLKVALKGRPLDYIFPTHGESPHMGNSELLLDEYPDSVLIGDLRNYHLYYPDHTHRFREMRAGDRIDLGGREIWLTPAAIHDLPNTLWCYEPRDKILIVADGYPFTHEHNAGQCALTDVEMPRRPQAKDTTLVIERALSWTRYVDAERTIAELDAFLKEYPTEIVGPTHGAITLDLAGISAVFKEGLRRIRGGGTQGGVDGAR